VTRVPFWWRTPRSDMPRDPISPQPIGYVHNRVHQPRPDGWDRVKSQIKLTVAEADEMLTGLNRYSHVLVVFWLDRLGAERPRPSQIQLGDGTTPTQGILATRSQLRPNPLGVSVVPLLEIRGTSLVVISLDAIDGTPVLDVKPYIPYYDSVPAARVPAWILGRPTQSAGPIAQLS
jgi:tRNA (adenine37-N6)-methyltransferase